MMDTFQTIVVYGVIAMIVLAVCGAVLGMLIVTLPTALLALGVAFALGLPIWAWVEYGWGGLAALALAGAAVALARRNGRTLGNTSS